MNFFHGNKVNDISEYNLPHDILNPSKCTKNINFHYYPILNGFMNTCKVKEIFKNLQIFLDSGFSSTIVMRSLTEKLKTKEDSVMHWHTYAVNITTNMKVEIYLTLPEFSGT